MSRYVVLGHGGFDPAGGSYPGEVLVPPGTTLQFFAEAGQSLVLPGTNYGKVANVWEQVAAEGSPIPEKWVTYNYQLQPDTTETHRQNALASDWGDDVNVWFLSTGAAFLCNGTADTCPTPALRVQEQAYENGEGEAVDDDRWNHHCTGILAQLAGHDIYWLACASIMSGDEVLPALDQSAASGPGVADVSTWVPTDAELQQIDDANARAVKATADGEAVSIVAGGVLVLIGSHERRPADYVRRQNDVEEGQVWVTKGGRLSKGTLDVTGINAKRQLVKDALGRFSDKKVNFT
jgi:hypothetical protein